MQRQPNKRIGMFISIPKNASKSILKILELGQNRDIDNTDSFVINENHQRGEVLNNRYDLSNIFVFSFVRHPVNRCLSWFYYHKNIAPYVGLNFDQWVEKGMPHHWKIQNQTNYVEKQISPLSQINFISNCNVDYIGKIEWFDRDLKNIITILNEKCISEKINHKFKYSNIRINANQYNSQQLKINSTTKSIVYEILKKDFQTFGYTND